MKAGVVAMLGADLGYDSLLQLRLIERLRTEFPQLQDTPVDELLPAIQTVDDLMRFVARRTTSKEVAR